MQPDGRSKQDGDTTRLHTAEIEGYRSLRNVEVAFESLTACIGPNGSGKSSLLGALKLFFDPTSAVDTRDYWCGPDGPVQEIAIRLTFAELTTEERTQFEPYLDEAERLKVERRFELDGAATYLGHRQAVPAFTNIRMLDRAHRDKFNELVESGDFEGLERAASKDEAFQKMRAWEAANPDQCQVLEVEFEPLDELFEAVNFLSVEAFEDPATHVDAQGKGAIGKLLGEVIDHRAVQEALDAIAEDATERSRALLLERSDGFRSFTDAMKNQLDRFAPGFSVKVDWTPPTIRGATPKLEVNIESAEGLQRPLSYQGHGVQRALMYAALTAQVEADAGARGDPILLVIEEPEAFQHPLSCRVLSATLRELSQRNYQIIYSTHSPYFIHPELIGGLRIFRREDRAGDGASTHIESLDEARLLEVWLQVFELERATTTTQSVLAHLQPHLPAEVLEGLFARLCVLVEGPGDAAVVRAAASLRGLDLDSAGISVLHTSGKAAMPNVSTFLSLAGVEVYPVFDLDRDKAESNQHRGAELQIMRSLAIDGDPEVGVGEKYACWEKNLTEQLRDELGDSYDKALAQAAESCGYSSSRGEKVATVMSELLQRAEAMGKRSESVSHLGERLAQLIGD